MAREWKSGRWAGIGVGASLLLLPLVPAETQSVYDQFVLGSPTNAVGAGVLPPPQNITGVWIRLNHTATGNDDAWLFYNGTAGPTGLDVDVRWYKVNEEYIVSSACAKEFVQPDNCRVPVGAAFANVRAVAGTEISFHFKYIYNTA